MAEIILLLIAAHFVCDYPLQGDYLSKAKASGELRVYHLIVHSGIHAGAVTLITGSAVLGILEWIAHAITDELKVRGKISFALDQFIHITCKLAIAGLFYVMQ